MREDRTNSPQLAAEHQPELPRSRFAQGMARLDRYSRELRLGRFSEGMESDPDSPQRNHRGRFSEGQERLAGDRLEKHIRRRFSERD
jgi:hypothetical protein